MLAVEARSYGLRPGVTAPACGPSARSLSLAMKRPHWWPVLEAPQLDWPAEEIATPDRSYHRSDSSSKSKH
jgi:hypothetical protein